MTTADRNGNLTPVSIDSHEPWSPPQSANPFQKPSSQQQRPHLSPHSQQNSFQQSNTGQQSLGGYPPGRRPPLATPPASSHASAAFSLSDGFGPSGGGVPQSPYGMSRRTMSNSGHPSPPSSVARSSDGAALYNRMSESGGSGINGMGGGPPTGARPNTAMMEERLGEHYLELKVYLASYLRDERGNPRQARARDKLLRLSVVQFQELSTDVYDELRRREDERSGMGGPDGGRVPKFLLSRQNFHPKRNQARQKLSTLPTERFQQLAADVFFELERRFPRFTGGDIDRVGSPAMSVRSGRSNGSRAPNGMPPQGYRGPPPAGRGGPPYRNGPPMGPGGPHGPPSRRGSGFDRSMPVPKTFQQNTIVPNKSTMVEDDDDQSVSEDDEDAFGLEGAAARQSRRVTGKGLSRQGDKIVTDLQNQLSQMEEKADSLEAQLRDKEDDLERARSLKADNEVDRAEWTELRQDLERKVSDAQRLNDDLESELNQLRVDSDKVERDLRAEIENTRDIGSGAGELQQRCEELEQEVKQQRGVAEEVRREASQFLLEMRSLSEQSDRAADKEDKLTNQVARLEGELREWKARYTRTKTQARNASSVGLPASHIQSLSAAASEARNSFFNPQGMIRDVHFTRFQIAIDELLNRARGPDSSALVSEAVKGVVSAVRKMTTGINISAAGAQAKQEQKLKARVSATANNLITAAKNHAHSAGLAPVSLLDAAASHLSTAVIDLVRFVKLRPTSPDDDESEDEGQAGNSVAPLPNGYHGSSGSIVQRLGSINGGHRRNESSKGSFAFSAYSGGHGGSSSVGGSSPYLGNGELPSVDEGLQEFKAYLDDQTATMVHNIQPLVHTIRSAPTGSALSADEENKLDQHISEISTTVQDIATQTENAVQSISGTATSKALTKHARPVIGVLEECRSGLLNAKRREDMPPLAFRIARATKELVTRVERIERGDLTAGDNCEQNF